MKLSHINYFPSFCGRRLDEYQEDKTERQLLTESSHRAAGGWVRGPLKGPTWGWHCAVPSVDLTDGVQALSLSWSKCPKRVQLCWTHFLLLRTSKVGRSVSQQLTEISLVFLLHLLISSFRKFDPC